MVTFEVETRQRDQAGSEQQGASVSDGFGGLSPDKDGVEVEERGWCE